MSAQNLGRRRSLRTAIFPSAKDLALDYPALRAHPALLPLIWQKRLAQYLLRSIGDPDGRPTDTLKLGKKRLELLREYGILDRE